MSELTNMLRNQVAESEAKVEHLTQAAQQVQDQLRIEHEKLTHARGLLSLMGGGDQSQEKPSETDNISPNDNSLQAGANDPFIANRIPKKVRMAEEISKILRTGSAHRKDILDRLVADGIMGTEKDPLAHLAAFLTAHRNLFESDGRGRFRLRSSGQAEPSPALNGAGSAEGRNPGSDPGLPFNLPH